MQEVQPHLGGAVLDLLRHLAHGVVAQQVSTARAVSMLCLSARAALDMQVMLSHLGGAFLDLLRHLAHSSVAKQVSTAQAAIGHHCDAVLLAVAQDLCVGEFWMQLHLHARYPASGRM